VIGLWETAVDGVRGAAESPAGMAAGAKEHPIN